MRRSAVAALTVLLLAGCASLGALAGIQAPRFEAADSRQGQLQLLGPSMRHPLGAVQVRLFARITNPNPLALTLSRVVGTLALEGNRAANVELPLGLPLPAAGDTIIPLDIEFGLADIPSLAQILPNAIARGSVDYDLEGSFTVDAGLLGQPSFGPMTLLQGVVQTR